MESTKEKTEKVLSEFRARLKGFLEEVKEAGSRMKNDLTDRMDDLHNVADKVKDEVGDKEKWKEVETGLKQAAAEMENTLKTAFSTSKKGDSEKKDGTS